MSTNKEDRTQGYKNGEDCPRCRDGIITLRLKEIIDLSTGKRWGTAEFAQCSRCYWNSDSN